MNMSPELKSHHLEALRYALSAKQDADRRESPGKAWVHAKFLKGSRVADECKDMGLLERSLKPVTTKDDGRERIFSYRITEAGEAALANLKPKTLADLEAALDEANSRNATLQAALIETTQEAEMLRAQNVALAEKQLSDMPDLSADLEDMDAEALRVIIGQQGAQIRAKNAEITEVRGQNVKLKNERDDYDKIGKDALSKMRIAERDRDELKPQIKTLNENLKAARTRADQLDADLTAARRGELEAKAAAAESGLRAEAAEQRLEQLTAPRPGGHIIARNISEAELDAYRDEGRTIAHMQFMPDGTLNAVISPRPDQPERRKPLNQPAFTPSGIPIPNIGRVPVPPVPSSNAPRTPAPRHVVTGEPAFNSQLVGVLGKRQDRGGTDRAIAVAREFVRDGLWDGFTCVLCIIEPYEVHDRQVFGLKPVRPAQLVEGTHYKFSPADPAMLDNTTPDHAKPLVAAMREKSAAQRTGAPLHPTHVADTATRALIIAPKPIDIPPAADAPKRVPTFNEILAARLSGQINADQFTKYANALAGHNARQKVGAMHS